MLERFDLKKKRFILRSFIFGFLRNFIKLKESLPDIITKIIYFILDGVCRRKGNRQRNYKRIGSYQTIGGIATFFGLSSLIGYRFRMPFVRTQYIKRIVYGNSSILEQNLSDSSDQIQISENLLKNSKFFFNLCSILYTFKTKYLAFWFLVF